MSLWDDGAEHTATFYGPPVATTDSAGGEVLTWPTVRTADVPCIVNPTGSRTEERFGQQGILRTYTISFLSDYATPARGDKALDSLGNYHHVLGIKPGQAMGDVPSLSYVDTEVWT